ncbi:MAG: DnaJ domain-containing protein [Deltaproteobacteria bacterium]|nr:DnaJ domain-containing protein [Deltaproteobacteria bacterium]
MSRNEACAILNLETTAPREEIENAYQRLVRRYPPEFHPEKFRQIDEAYRSLTSLPFLLEKLLGPETEEKPDPDLFLFSPSPPSSIEDALLEIQKQFKMAHLWPGPKT